jgi:hypothetical protein
MKAWKSLDLLTAFPSPLRNQKGDLHAGKNYIK